MSVEEMKQKAMMHLTNLTSEEAVKEILQHLEKIDEVEKKSLNLSQQYPSIKQQYSSVLEKLAK